MELTLDQALQKGIDAHKAGKAQEADRYYTAVLKVNPKHPDANHNMGVLAVSIGKVAEAVPFFKSALEVNPKIQQYWLSYIDALIKLERSGDAIAAVKQAKSNGVIGIRLNKLETLLGSSSHHNSNIQEPTQKELSALITLCDKKRLQQAFVEAQVLTKRYHKSFTLWYILGALAAQIGRANEAVEAFQEVLAIKPDHSEAYFNMGVTLKEQGKLDEAIEAYKKALYLRPDYANAYNNLGVVFKEQGELEEAIGAYRKAISIHPDYADAYNNLGNALQRQGKQEEAIDAYKKVLSIKPENAEAYNNIGVNFKEIGKLREAIAAFRKALSIKPDYAYAFNNMGVALKEQGKLDEAIKAYQKAISMRPDYANAYNNLGATLKEQGKLEEAIKAYTKAISIHPNYAEAYNNIGNALLKDEGKLDNAIQAYKKALSIKPDYGTAKHMLSALTGQTNETAPREYVENLFDGYSRKFEVSLVDKLEYGLPKLITNFLVESDTDQNLGSVIDLGCGTGLLGPQITRHCSRLEGIDLSGKMLEIARQKNVYDKLSQFDIVEYLSRMPLNFDYFIALDVFIYVGELTEIFRLIKYRNSQIGKLVFSTEHTETDGYHILKSGRYSHSKSYIEHLCKKFGFNMTNFFTTNLRKENSEFLTGGIYILSFKPH